MLGGQAMAQGEFFAFSRAQEQAADQAGMTFLDRLGWSGSGLRRLLLRMQEQEMLVVGRQDPYLRTHPLSRDRLEFVTDWVERAGAARGVDGLGMLVEQAAESFFLWRGARPQTAAVLALLAGGPAAGCGSAPAIRQ